MGFQTQVNTVQAPALEGDFASSNPRASVLAGEGALVVGALPLAVGRFGWIDSTGVLVTNNGVGVPDGFVHRTFEGLLIVWLQEANLACLQPGYPIALFTRGDFWARTLTVATKGQKVFANLGTGQVSTGAAGSTIANFAGTASFATNVMTVTATSSGSLKVGDVITSAGVATGTYITSFGTGSGGNGTYNLSTTPGTIAGQAVTSTSYVETTWKVATPGAVGDVIMISTWY